MKYFSLFSGIGGFELGIQQALQNNVCLQKGKYQAEDSGCKTNSWVEPKQSERLGCIGFSEIDKYATQIYKKHFPTHKEYGDVTNIKWSNVPDFELLCGGFPCQSFSIAGKRGGFSDTRGTLFFEIARATQEKHPRLLLLENVKGLLSHDKGRTFGTILNTLDELGYDLQWQVLNSKNFGVPQNRERVFIIGHLRTTPRPQVFPLQQTNAIHLKNDDRKIAKCLDSNYHKGWLDHGQRTMIALCIRAEHHNTADVHFITDTMEVANAVTPDAYLASGKRKRVNGKAVLTSMHERRIRRLTPTECERLQGFPDGWTKKGVDMKGNCVPISDTQRYKCLGNAVTVNVIEEIMKNLKFRLDSLRRIC